MEKDILDFCEKFMEIKKMGWVKSVNNRNNGVGLTLENLFGISENELEIPDYNGIELKTKRYCSNSYIILFSCTPTGPHYHEVEVIKDKYGYPHKSLNDYKVLNKSVYSNKKTKIGCNFYFQLEINRDLKKIYLVVFDKLGNFIEKSTFWDFDILEEKLNRKFSILALVKALSKNQMGAEYFKYNELKLYTLKDFTTFLNLLECGVIRLNFKLNIWTKGPKIGGIHDHGTSFDILEKDFTKLFNQYKILK